MLSAIGTANVIRTFGGGAGGTDRSEGSVSEPCRRPRPRSDENVPDILGKPNAIITPYTASMMIVRCVLPRPVRQRSRDRESALA